eukprot:Skav201833  [mRNA]  locus=scaffold5003:56845:60405:+ [translate_table: standard]
MTRVVQERQLSIALPGLQLAQSLRILHRPQQLHLGFPKAIWELHGHLARRPRGKDFYDLAHSHLLLEVPASHQSCDFVSRLKWRCFIVFLLLIY